MEGILAATFYITTINFCFAIIVYCFGLFLFFVQDYSSHSTQHLLSRRGVCRSEWSEGPPWFGRVVREMLRFAQHDGVLVVLSVAKNLLGLAELFGRGFALLSM